jgi:hypothetical protein
MKHRAAFGWTGRELKTRHRLEIRHGMTWLPMIAAGLLLSVAFGLVLAYSI